MNVVGVHGENGNSARMMGFATQNRRTLANTHSVIRGESKCLGGTQQVIDGTPSNTSFHHGILPRRSESYEEQSGDVNAITVEALLVGGELVLDSEAFFTKCWLTATAPDFRIICKAITILKPSKPLSELSSHRPISLLVVQGKLYTRCLLRRVEILAEQVIGEWQGGFHTA